MVVEFKIEKKAGGVVVYDYLIIAEKKTLAEDVAKAFKFRKFQSGWIEAEDPEIGKAKILWVFGHVLRIDVNETFKSAGYPEKFPVFPERLILTPEDKRKSLLKALGSEIKKGSWKYVVNAGDPDREGELLVREVLGYFKVPENKVLRLWFNSQESEALRKALLAMRPASDYGHVYVAGLARQIGDLWFGINGSRALHRITNNYNLSIGRVQTPVLKLIVDRYFEVKNFKPEDYYVVWIEVEKEGKTARAAYLKKESGLVKKEEARKIFQAVKNEKTALVKEVEKKKHKKLPPNLYVLSSLIKDAGKFGFTAQKTLEVVQKLYEHYKCVSYPRTESCYLATADRPYVEKVLRRLGYEQFLSKIPDGIFNDEDVSEAGHHAIIPINKLPDNASKDERLIYDLILRRFIAQFYPAYEYELTKVIFECGGYEFQAVGKVDLNLGWKSVYLDLEKKEKESKKERELKEESENGESEENVQEGLPKFVKEEKVKKVEDGVEKRQTSPPPLYTSSTLVAEMKKKGLGTEATRSTFETLLLKRGYVYRDAKNKLYPTEKGMSLVELVKNEQFASVDYTAEWEVMLDRILRKREVNLKEKFLLGVKELTLNFVKKLEKNANVNEIRVLSESSKKKAIEDFKRKNKREGKKKRYGKKLFLSKKRRS